MNLLSIKNTLLSFNTVFYLLFFALGFLFVFLSYRILNNIPEKWLCDYDEEPTSALEGTRYIFNKNAVFLSIFVGILLGFLYYSYGSNTVLLVFYLLLFIILLLAALADGKYTIIPDQFVITIAVLGVIYAIVDFNTYKFFIRSWYSPILGALGGGGVLFLIDILGKLIFKKDAIGFGDIKLFAAIGIFVGFRNIMIIGIISIFAAFFHFLFLLIFKKAEMSSYLPLGPYISIGTALFIAFYYYIFAFVIWYFKLIGI